MTKLYEYIVICLLTEFHMSSNLLLWNKKLYGDFTWLDIVLFYKKLYLHKCFLFFFFLIS
jgi:hypothetical protein